jgi:hypothetical protein
MTRTLTTIAIAAWLLIGSTWAGEQSTHEVTSRIDPDETLDYGRKISCIELRRIRETRVLDTQHMLFYMRGPIIYLNQFEGPCASLTDKRITSFKTALDGRLCRMDRLEVLHDLLIREYRGAGRTDYQTLSSCLVGPFEQVNAEQAEFLRTQSTRSGGTIMDMLRGYQTQEKEPQ